MSNPAYSPDFFPTDYRFFKDLNHFLRGKIIVDCDSVKDAFTQFTDFCNSDFYVHGINLLVSLWQKCVDSEGLQNPQNTGNFREYCGDFGKNPCVTCYYGYIFLQRPPTSFDSVLTPYVEPQEMLSETGKDTEFERLRYFQMAEKIKEMLGPYDGVLSCEDDLTPVFCKPKLIPLKSVTIEKLEKMQRDAAEKAKADENNKLQESEITNNKPHPTVEHKTDIWLSKN